MATGVVKVWLEDRGFGFVTEPDGEDVFVHVKSLPPGTARLSPGDRVTFRKKDTSRGVQAFEVALVDGSPDVIAEDVFCREMSTALDGDVGSAGLESMLEVARAHGWVA